MRKIAITVYNPCQIWELIAQKWVKIVSKIGDKLEEKNKQFGLFKRNESVL